MEVLRQPFWPYASFFAINAQPLNQYPPAPETKKTMKRKNQEIDREEEESDDSTEVTGSCEFSSKIKKPRTSETRSTATSHIEKKPLVNANFSEKEEWLKRNNYSNKEVSTELTLFDETCVNKKRNNLEQSAAYTSRIKEEPLSKDALEAEWNKTVVASRISAMKYYNPKEEQEESRMGVSTKLKLYEDPFKIKKQLTKSDLGNWCRLLVKKDLVKKHIFPYLTTHCVNEIESDKGTRVMVWDHDTNSMHQLIFKRWPTSRSYVFNDNWRQDFVRRRDLKEGDEIGLYYDPYDSRFNFRVLKRAPTNQVTVC